MKKVLLLLTVILILATAMKAQQDPMFTKYMFNSLLYNPAYAGSKEYMSIVLLHRDQWWGIDGGPKTQSFTLHTPLNDPRVGVGLAFYNDAIGPVDQMNLNASYAYRVPLGSGNLSFGIQASVMNWKANWDELRLQIGADAAFMNQQDNFLLPNFGAGVYYYGDKFYLGASVPHFMNHVLAEDARVTGQEDQQIARQIRHYFVAGGFVIPLNQTEDLVFKPSFVIKNSNLFGEFDAFANTSTIGAPTEFDLDMSMMFYKTLWVGTSFRAAFEGFSGQSSFDSVDFWAAYFLKNGFRVGVAYDFPVTELLTPAQGSVEIMLGYEFDYKESKIVTPRYF